MHKNTHQPQFTLTFSLCADERKMMGFFCKGLWEKMRSVYLWIFSCVFYAFLSDELRGIQELNWLLLDCWVLLVNSITTCLDLFSFWVCQFLSRNIFGLTLIQVLRTDKGLWHREMTLSNFSESCVVRIRIRQSQFYFYRWLEKPPFKGAQISVHSDWRRFFFQRCFCYDGVPNCFCPAGLAAVSVPQLSQEGISAASPWEHLSTWPQ